MKTKLLSYMLLLFVTTLFAQIPANDECANAEVIIDDITTATTISFDNSQATESLESSCDTNPDDYLDLWYEFIMPITGNLRFSGVNFADEFTLYDSCGDIPTEVACFSNFTYLYNLPAGTYTLRVYSTDGNAGADSFVMQAIPIAANDECANAEVITDDITTATTINFDNSQATESLDASCDNAATTYLDLWYEFTMPITGNLRFSGVNFADEFTLYDSCGDIPTEVACFSNFTYLYNLPAGTYTLRVYSIDGNAGADSFTMQAIPIAANDECANAEVITNDITTATTITFNNSQATESLDASCDNAATNYLDLWYEFTMPVSGNLSFTGVNFADEFTLYDSCGDIPTEVACFANATTLNGILAGTYTLRVYSTDSNAGADSFIMQAFDVALNDECVDATVITDDISNPVTISYNNDNATESLQASCDLVTETYPDLWYEFTMPFDGNLRFSGVNFADQFTLYDSCADIPTEVACFFNFTYIYNLPAGTYTLRAYSTVSNANADSFTMQAFPIALNDECVNAEVISDDLTNLVTINYNNTQATESLEASCDTNVDDYLDLWYEITMPFNGNIRFSNINFTSRFTLYDACNSIPTEVGCTNDDSNINNLTAGSYLLRVSSTDGDAGNRSFNMQAIATIPNDTCATALPIQVATSGACVTENNIVDMRGATPAPTLSSCVTQTQEYYDAWYTFQAPLTGNVFLNTTSVFDNYAVYDACSGNELICFNNNGSIPVTFGTTYYLQLLKRTPFLDEVTFCLEGAPSVALGIMSTCETLPSIEISTAEGNTNEWVAIFDSSNNIAAAINANGNDLGTIDTTLFIDANDVRTSGTQPYLRREISITPQNQPTSNVDVRLYVLEDEMLDLIAADANLPNSLFLDLMKVDGTTCTTGYSGGGDFVNANTTAYGNDYYIQSLISSFSVFYPTSTNLSTTLSTEAFENSLGVSIYPTVSNGIINIKAEKSLGKTELSVFDINGRIIQYSEVELDSNAIQINLENANKGLYFIKLENNGASKTQKIILK